MLFCYLSFGVVYGQCPQYYKNCKFFSGKLWQKVLKFQEFLPFVLKNTPNFALLTFYVKTTDIRCQW